MQDAPSSTATQHPAPDSPVSDAFRTASDQTQELLGPPTSVAESPVAQAIVSAIDPVLEVTPHWAHVPILIVSPIVLALMVQVVVYAVLRGVTRKEGKTPTRRLVARTRLPARVLAIAIGAGAGFTLAIGRGDMPAWFRDIAPQSATVVTILSITGIVIGLISGIDDMILARYRIDVKDNLRARRMHTQVRVISKTIMILIGIAGISIALMTFDKVEKLGASLLASAGVAGIAVGFAARPVLGNIIAGIQIALTQPIRIDDAVVIEGEWGWIEEITTTYVVVRIWDERRLIVPFSKIIEEPFQNWTRRSANILGSVVLHVDHSCPVEEVRAELERALKANDKWDGRAQVLQVIETTERTIVLRALMTAADSPTCWDLRCDIREHLIAFLQREHPESLPRIRTVWYDAGKHTEPAIQADPHHDAPISHPSAPVAKPEDQPPLPPDEVGGDLPPSPQV